MRTSVLTISIPVFLCAVTVGAAGVDELRDPREVHLADVVQLTSGGENAEGYWSPDGAELVYQATGRAGGCDQIYRIAADGSGAPVRVSTGEGRTTCSYFSYPDGDRVLYATTHLADAACPAPPDHSQGYVWALYTGYDIVSVAPDGSDLRRVTETPGYDAEATVCPTGPEQGRVVFTSVRDGDLDLYTMAADGSEVTRITDTPGYDGGAFFSPDCSKIVWRASRPRSEEELARYRDLLAQGLIRPTRLELWVADGDGSNARQITWYGAASFAPAFFPSGERLIFSSNLGDSRGREFDLWAVDLDGTDLERITWTGEFDGFPLFSPDGSRLAFASNRFHELDGETNLFVARWDDATPPDLDAGLPEGREDELRAPDRYRADVAWLADDAREGRGVGTQGLIEARDWLARRFDEVGLEPAGEDGGWLQPFDVAVAVEVDAGTRLVVSGAELPDDAFTPASFSSSASASGSVVAAGYGIDAPESGIDDYAGLDVDGKLVAVRRFTPASIEVDDAVRRFGDLRYKAFVAREHGAAGLLIVDLPEVLEGGEAPDDADLPGLTVDSSGDAGLPVAIVTREAGAGLFEEGATAELTVKLARRTAPAWNVVGRLPGGAAGATDSGETGEGSGAVIVGAHYDHLGYGGTSSLAPGSDEPHNGADDNASGTAALLEAARVLASRRSELGPLGRDVVFVSFSGEESGILGSGAFVREPPAGLDVEHATAMINMDMVGRLRDRLTVLGIDSADEWETLVPPLCADLDLPCELGGDAYGPSDHTSFYAAGVPVLMLFTGVHDDYHKPTDDTARINAAGGARIARLAADVATALAERPDALTYRKLAAPAPRGDSRSGGASLGVVPDYAGEGKEGGEGMLVADVRPEGPADQAGIRRDDRLVELAGHEIRDVYDLVYVLRQSKPGQTVQAVVVRDGERIETEVTFGESTRPRG